MDDTQYKSRIEALLASNPDALTVTDVAQLFQTLHGSDFSAVLVAQYAPQITRQLTSYCSTPNAPLAALEFLHHPSYLGRFFGLTVIESLPKPFSLELSFKFINTVLSSLAASLASQDPQARVFQNKALLTIAQLLTSDELGHQPWLAYTTDVLDLNGDLSQYTDGIGQNRMSLSPVNERVLERLSQAAIVCLLRLCYEYGTLFTSSWWPSKHLDEPHRVSLLQTLDDIRIVTLFGLRFSVQSQIGSRPLTEGEIQIRSLAVENLCVWKPSISLSPDSTIKSSLDGTMNLALHFLALGSNPKVCEAFREMVLVNEFKSISELDLELVANLFITQPILARLSESQTGDEDALPYLRLFLTFVGEHARKASSSEEMTEFLPTVGQVTSEHMQRLVLDIMVASEPPPECPVLTWYFEFWDGVVDCLTEVHDEQNPRLWYIATLPCVFQAMGIFIPKLRYPSDSHIWNYDETEEFLEFRRDIGELMLNFYSLCGPELLHCLIQLRSTVLPPGGNWQNIELIFWCVSVLADALDEDDAKWGDSSTDEMLSVLISPLFESSIIDQAPTQVKICAAKVLNSLGLFFRRRPEFLLVALNFLFNLLSSPDTAHAGSEGLHTLCKLCGSLVTTNYGELVLALHPVIESPSVELKVKCKVIGGLAAVCGAKCRQEGTLSFLYDMLTIIVLERDRYIALSQVLKPVNIQTSIAAISHAEVSVAYLAAIAKAFHVSEAFSSDQWDSGDTDTLHHERIRQEQLDRLQTLVRDERVREHIHDLLLSILRPLRTNPVIVEHICAVLKAGFVETSLGPFVLPSGSFHTLLCLLDITTPDVATHWLSSACSFLNSYIFEQGTQDERLRSVLELHQILSGVIQNFLLTREQDDDIAVSILKFSCSLCRFYPVIGHSGSLTPAATDHVSRFAQQALSSLQPSSRAQAIQFWIKLLSLTNEEAKSQQWLDEIFLAVQEELCSSIMERIMLHALRGEIVHYTKLLHALVRRNVRSRALINAAVDEIIARTRATRKQADIFVRSLSSPRLQRIVQCFWEQCLGLDK